jgi:hypothetical protein
MTDKLDNCTADGCGRAGSGNVSGLFRNYGNTGVVGAPVAG